MNNAFQKDLPAKKVIEFLNQETPITNQIICEKLIIEVSKVWNKKIIFENCSIKYFSGIGTHFKKQVIFRNCDFENCDFTFSYFFGGLIIENCNFNDYLDFKREDIIEMEIKSKYQITSLMIL